MLDSERSLAVKMSGNKLPLIEHPLLKATKENSLEIGVSPFSERPDHGRPVPFEDELKYKLKRNSDTSRTSSRISKSDSVLDCVNLNGTFLTNIPESFSVMGGNTNSTRLPLFGSRSSIQSRSSNNSRQVSLKQTGCDLTEVMERFQKKLSSNYYEIRKKFIDNDPDRNGNVQREALMRILQQTTGLEIDNNCLSNLLRAWGLKSDKQMFSFCEINSVFMKKSKEKNGTNFLDPVNRQKCNLVVPSKMAASDVYELLNGKFRLRELYLSDLFPESVESQTFNFNKYDLKNALVKNMIDLLPSELDKLWMKFDPAKEGSINGLRFLKQLGIILHPSSSLTPRIKGTNDITKTNDIINSFEQQLKSKLREGFIALGNDFQKKDVEKTGFISSTDFLQVLSDNNLNLEQIHLKEFLSRCVVPVIKNGIPYRDFLVRYQDRSEAGVTHKLLSDRNNKKISHNEGQTNPVSLIELKLLNIFQKDFLELLENFRNLDKNQDDSITLKDFQNVLEKVLKITFTEQQFKKIVENLPLDKNHNLLYLDFLKQFDTGNFSPMLFPNEYENNQISNKSESLLTETGDEGNSEKSIKEIKNIIKQAFDSRYVEIEKLFEELDQFNSKVLSQEMMYQLMKKLKIHPELTRGDIRTIWSTFILNERQLLDFKEFTRQFMYNKLTSSFPNAKLFPPVKGDSDLMQKSRKLNSTSDIVVDNLRSKVEIMCNDLYLELVNMDTENTGEVSMEDFQEILKELCIELTDHEIQTICEKFKTSTNKIGYTELLKPLGVYKHQRNLAQNSVEISKKQKSKSPCNPNVKYNTALELKLQLLKQPVMRRYIKKIDSSNSGLIPILELKTMLQMQGVSLSEDEIYSLRSKYDKHLSGHINYKSLLHELNFDN